RGGRGAAFQALGGRWLHPAADPGDAGRLGQHQLRGSCLHGFPHVPRQMGA
ncbi:hypothetical protein MyNCGM683_52550, partial [Achromobacter xylosoxidans]